MEDGMFRRKPTALWASSLVLAGFIHLGLPCDAQIPHRAQEVARRPNKNLPAITQQPRDLTVLTGQGATFRVAVSGKSPFYYQWRKNGQAIPQARQSSYSIPATQFSHAGAYDVVVTNRFGSVRSNSATLTVNPLPTAPVIASQPQSLTVTEGQNASFAVTATGTAPFTYQWRKAGMNLAGATSALLELTPAQMGDAGSYDVVISNSVGSATSTPATLVVNPRPVPPTILTQPVAQTALVGDRVAFTVEANGIPTPTYQWYKDGSALPGAASATLEIPSATPADAGSYQAVATNSVGSASSALVDLVVKPAAPVIATQPQSTLVNPPDGATFSVNATGTGLSYQWAKNGTDIPGATSATFAVSATDLNEISASYRVIVTNETASVASENATLTVMAPNPTYAGDPIAVPSRPLTVLPSYNVGPAFPNGAFRLGYDEAVKCPAWTAYADFKFITPFANGTRTFLPDDRLAMPQVQDSDYTGSGWTRGHQVMMSDLAYRYGTQAGTDTCRLSNIAPQKDTHNNNFWNNFEQIVGGSNPTAWVPGLADTFNRIWVYTGPVFDAVPQRFGAPSIAIPSGFYKIIVREEAPGQPKVLAVLAPHAYTPANGDLWKYTTTVEHIEQIAHLDFFPTPTSPLPVEFKTTVDVRGWGLAFENTDKPNVHIVDPSWDTTVNVGDSLTFTGAATSSNSTVVSTSWTFGDGSTATTNPASHTFTSGGPVTVTFTATDGLGVTHSVTRVITVSGGNVAPTLSALPNRSTTVDTPVTVAFTASDDSTPAASLTLTATSSNQALIPDSSLSVTNTNGACTLLLTPVTGQTGTATLTVIASDGTASTTATFTFTVTSGGTGTPGAALISQYYEGTTASRFVEITNVGGGALNLASPQLYLVLFANPTATTDMNTKVPTSSQALTGTLAPGQSILVMQSGSTVPAYAVSSATTSAACSFNGNDPLVLSTANAVGTAWAQRVDMIGLTDGTNWGLDRSFVRNPAVLLSNPVYTPSEWTQKTVPEIDGAASGTTERLGEHVYNH